VETTYLAHTYLETNNQREGRGRGKNPQRFAKHSANDPQRSASSTAPAVQQYTIALQISRRLPRKSRIVKRKALCDSRKYPYPPHGGSRKFLGVWGSKGDKFPKGRGVHKEFFFPEGLKCDQINTYVLFPLLQVTKKNKKFYPLK